MKKSSKIAKFVILPLVILIAVAGAGYGGYYFGLTKAKQELPPPVFNENQLAADFSLFWEVVGNVKNGFFNIEQVTDQQLLYGAIRGAIQSLDDPYSEFFEPSDAKKFEEDIQGSFGGIGAEIGIKNDQLVIVAPLKGNPAEKVGLKAGDKIMQVDGKETAGLTVEEAVKLIRGEEGTEVKLLIFRNGWEEAREFKIVRAVIVLPTLEYEIKDGHILYIHLQNFNGNAPTKFYEALLDGVFDGADGLVLDLRNNPGGYLDVSIRIAGWFLERGAVVTKERFANGEEKALYSAGSGALKDFPMVVLVNSGSASASEIVAGALHDHRGIKLIGEKTFGKGTVQELENLKDGSVLKLSTAEWLTPNGNSIEKKGLTPDIEIKMSDEDVEAGRDPQLEKAIEILRNEINST